MGKPEYSLEFTKDQLASLAREYESGNHVDISAFNYFEMALEWIVELQNRTGIERCYEAWAKIERGGQ